MVATEPESLSSAPIRYVRRGDVQVAFMTEGIGLPLFYLPVFGHNHLQLESQTVQRRNLFRSLAADHQLIRLDYRCTGLSSDGPLSLDSLADDIESIADHLRLTNYAVLATQVATPMAIRLATKHGSRLGQLILWRPQVKPPPNASLIDALDSLVEQDWEHFVDFRFRLDVASDEATELAYIVKKSVTPKNYLLERALRKERDFSDELKAVNAPTLVMHARGNVLYHDQSSLVASLIRDAKLVSVSGASPQIYNCDIAEIAQTIRDFTSTNSFATTSADQKSVGAVEPMPELTNREREVLALLARGLRGKEIARVLSLSPHTVERHISNLYERTGAHGRVALMAFAYSRGLLSDLVEDDSPEDRG